MPYRWLATGAAQRMNVNARERQRVWPRPDIFSHIRHGGMQGHNPTKERFRAADASRTAPSTAEPVGATQ